MIFICKHVLLRCVVIYEDDSHFNALIFVGHDKVNKFETKFSQNARAETKKKRYVTA